MAIKPFNSINGFSVSGNGNVIIDSAGNITTDSIIVAQNANLGNIANVKIGGGSNGYVIATDGAGNLSFVAGGGGGGNTSITSPMPTLINSGETYYVTANHQGLYSVPIEINGALEVDGVLVQVDGIAFDGPTGNTQIFYNDNSVVSGSANLTFNKTNSTLTANNFVATTSANLGAVGNVTITGGTSGYVLSTNGSGGLSWVAQTGGGGSGNSIANGTSNVSIPVVNGNVIVGANGNSWTFDTTGNLSIPSNGGIVSGSGYLNLSLDSLPYVLLKPNAADANTSLSLSDAAYLSGNSEVVLTSQQQIVIQTNANQWYFTNQGETLLPNNTLLTRGNVAISTGNGGVAGIAISLIDTGVVYTGSNPTPDLLMEFYFNYDGTYSYQTFTSGTGFSLGDTVLYPGDLLDGTTPTNDATFTVTQIDGSGTILDGTFVGTHANVAQVWNFTRDGSITKGNGTLELNSTSNSIYLTPNSLSSSTQFILNDNSVYVQTVNEIAMFVGSKFWYFDDNGTTGFPNQQILTSGNIAINTGNDKDFGNVSLTAPGVIYTGSNPTPVLTITIQFSQNGNYYVYDWTSGTGFSIGDTIYYPGTILDGTSPANDLTITISAVDGSGNVIHFSPIIGTHVNVEKIWNFTQDGTFSAAGNITTTGNITGGNIQTTGLANIGSLTVTGVSNLGPVSNVTITGGTSGQYLQTNGSGGLSWASVAAGSTSNISNGTSNVNIATSGGNVTTSVGGTSNVVVVTSTGANITGTLSTSGNAIVGNINTGIISATGNIIGNGNLIIQQQAFIGNGANSTTFSNPTIIAKNLGADYIQAALINGTSTGSSDWVSYADNGNDIAGWNDFGFTGSNYNDANFTITGKNDGYMFVQPVNGTGLGGNLVLATGEQGANRDIVFATGGFLSANEKMRLYDAGSQLQIKMTTPATTSATGALTVSGGVGVAGNIYSAGLINSASNINGANLTTGGLVTATGNVTGGNLTTGGALSVTGNANIGNIGTGGLITATGNITGGNITTGGLVSATGNITGGNITTSGLVSATGNVTGGNLTTAGILSVTGTGVSSINGNLNMSSKFVVSLSDPVNNQDAATKNYVDTKVSSGINYHQPVAAATTTTLATATGGTTAYNSPNGAANGIGAYISTTGTFNLIDTANIQTVGTRILVKDEANAAWNGVYTYANTTAIIRSTDTDEYGPDSTEQLSVNDYFFTTGGSVNKNTSYVLSSPNGTITFGTSNLIFSIFSTSQSYTAGTGLTLTGTVFSVNASQTQVTAVGTLTSLSVIGNANIGNIGTAGQIVSSIATGTSPFTIASTTRVANLNAATSGVANTVNDAAQGNITSVGILTSVSVSGNANIGNIGTSGLITATGNITGGNITTAGILVSSIATGTAPLTVTSTTEVANLFVYQSNIAGYVTAAAQGNITSLGTLSSLSVSGNANIGNIGTAILTTTGNITGANLVTGGVLSVTGNANIGNIGTAILTAIGNITGGNLTTSGTANVGTLIAGATTNNYAQITGGGAGKAVQFQSLGSDAAVSLAIQSKGTGAIDLAAGSSGVNISNGGTVTAITRTNTGTGFSTNPTWSATVPTTAGGVQSTGTTTIGFVGAATSINSGGTGYAVNDVLTIVGGTFTTAAQITVTSVSAGVITGLSVSNAGAYTVAPTSPVSVTGGTGSGATFAHTGLGVITLAISNAGSGYVEQPTVTFSGGGGSGAAAYATVGSIPTVKTLGSAMSFYTPGGEQARIIDTASPTLYVQLTGGQSGVTRPSIGVAGTGASGLNIFNSGGQSIYFATSGASSNVQLVVAHTASAVNYVQVTGAATGIAPIISVQGSDAAVPLSFSTKSTGSIRFYSGSSTYTQFRIDGTVSAVNYLQAAGSVASSAPILSAQGSDANIDLTLTPKGTGNLTTTANISATGNITGANLVTGGNLSVTGNANIGNIGTAQVLASANITTPQFISNIATGTAPFVVTSTTQVANLSVATAGSATTAGTVTTNAQPNITSTGTLASLSVSGNSNVGNLNSAGRVIAVDNVIVGSSGGEGGQIVVGFVGINNITGQANSTWNMDVDASNNFRLFSQNATGVVNGVSMTAYSANTNVLFAGNVTAGYFIGNGSQLTGITASAGAAITNGNSNVTVIANSNITMSVTSTANVVVISNTGANITGALSVSGNANIGNIGTGGLITATGNIAGGNLNTGGTANAAILTISGNATVGNLIGPHANGNSNIAISANSNIAMTVSGTANVLVVTTTGANITGALTTTGNVNVGNANAVTWANTSGVRVYTYYNDATSSLDTIFI